MGFRVTWLARKGTKGKLLLQETGLRATSERQPTPDDGLFLLEVPPSETGPWSMLIADGEDYYDGIEDQDAEALSQGGHDVLFFRCDDDAFASELRCFRDGTLVWSIRHDAEVEEHPSVLEGPVPDVTHALLSALRYEQKQSDEAGESVDYLYDLPADVGQALTGFRHDKDTELSKSGGCTRLEQDDAS